MYPVPDCLKGSWGVIVSVVVLVMQAYKFGDGASEEALKVCICLADEFNHQHSSPTTEDSSFHSLDPWLSKAWNT